MSERQKTNAGIIAEMRLDASKDENTPDGILGQTLNYFADLLEAAHRREADNIHRAMVILAGIEMIDPDYPPRLWTALEDAYDALSDAIGTDGCTTSDEEEAKSIGRHFVIQPFGDSAKLREAPEEIKLTREEERAIDKKLGPNFKKDMNEFAQKLQNLMVEFPMAQGHSKEARYLQQPFYMMSGALHLTKRFCMTEQERDEDDDVIASIPRALDALAGAFGGSGRQENKDGGNDGNEQQTA